MDNFFIVDFHAHPVETEANAQAMMAGNGQADCSGTVDELVSIMLAAGIDRAVLAVTAPTWAMYEEALSGPSQGIAGAREEAVIAKISGFIKNRNEWACQMAQQYDGLLPFVGLDPIMGLETMLAELSDKVEKRGAMGIKLHPGLGRYFPDDQRLWPVYEKATNLSLPILSHGGLFLADKEYTRPQNYNKVLCEFPELTLIIAHLGRIYFRETLALAERYPNAYFDTSSAVPGDENGEKLAQAEAFLGPLQPNDEVVEFINNVGVDRVLFGSDYPWFHPGYDLKRFLKLGLAEEEKQSILGENARRILAL